MEENYTEPQAVEQQPDVTTENTAVQQPAETEVQESVQAPQKDLMTRQQDNDNAQRRIRNRNGMRARIAELEKRLAQYEGKDDNYSKFQAGQLRDRIEDMNAIDGDEIVNEYEDHARRFFGDDAPYVMRQLEEYADYVNANEPDVKRYLHREYGPILMHEWCKRMDNANLRQEWLGMTAYEKGNILSRLYSGIENAVKGSKQKVASKSVPVPSGGRQTASSIPSDDFGVELGNAFNRHRN